MHGCYDQVHNNQERPALFFSKCGSFLEESRWELGSNLAFSRKKDHPNTCTHGAEYTVIVHLSKLISHYRNSLFTLLLQPHIQKRGQHNRVQDDLIIIYWNFNVTLRHVRTHQVLRKHLQHPFINWVHGSDELASNRRVSADQPRLLFVTDTTFNPCELFEKTRQMVPNHPRLYTASAQHLPNFYSNKHVHADLFKIHTNVPSVVRSRARSLLHPKDICHSGIDRAASNAGHNNMRHICILSCRKPCLSPLITLSGFSEDHP